MIHLSMSSLEDLPNELWMKIFGYCSLNDLYHSWVNLNARLNGIVHSIPIRFSIENEIDEDLWNYFSSQIISIKDQRLNAMNFWPMKLDSLIELRSIYLVRCSNQQLDEIVHLHRLVHLSLPPNSISEDFIEKYLLGQNREKSFPNLRSIGRIWIDQSSESSSSYEINESVRHIHLVIPTLRQNVQFIEYFPRLTSISVDYLAQRNPLFSSCFITMELFPKNRNEISSKNSIGEESLLIPNVIERIRSLSIQLNGFADWKYLSSMVNRCSKLEKLRIEMKYYSTDFDFTSLRSSNRFFSNLRFGDIQKDTGKPILIIQWP